MVSANPPAPPRNSRWVPWIVASAFFMENLDGTVITTALPQMGQSFAVSPIQLSIGITAYFLTVAIFIPASAWVADTFGTRNVFCCAIAAFTLTSILCGVSDSLWMFIGARVLQGASAAMMSPVGRVVALRGAEKHEIVRAVAMITWPSLIGPVVGPPLGGFLTTYATWRWIFFLNVPIGIVGVLLVLRFVGNHYGPARRFDLIGFVLAAASLACLMYGLDSIGHRQMAWWNAASLIAVGLGIGWVALRHARSRENPLIDLSPMRIPTFAIAMISGSFFRIGIFALPFLLPLMFQTAFGLSAFQSGLLMLVHMGGNLAMKVATTPILRRYGFRRLLIGNGLLSALSVLTFCFILPDWPLLPTLALLFLAGLFRSMQFTGLNTLTFADVPQAQRGASSAVSGTIHQLNSGMAVAFGTIVLQASLAFRATLDSPLTVGDFHLAFAAVVVLVLVGVWLARMLTPLAGVEVSGYRPKSGL